MQKIIKTIFEFIRSTKTINEKNDDSNNPRKLGETYSLEIIQKDSN